MVSTALSARGEQADEGLTGRQRVAILCMALGPERASRITARLSGEEIETISFEIARMDRVPRETVQAVLHEYLETTRAAETLATGGEELAREVLERAFGPQRAVQIYRRIQSQLHESAGLSKLRKVDPHQLVSLLRNEHPQTIALVLAHLDPSQTAAILKEIDPTIGASVVYRMACMEKVPPEMLELIERALGAATELHFAQGLSTAGGPQAVVAVLNLMNPSLEKELLDGIAERDSELCEQIKNLMFVFEDLVSLDTRSMQRLLRDVDSKELAMALKAASQDLKNHIMSAMSKRAMEALQEEMEYLGPVRLRDVESAQLAIVTRVRQLEENGEVVIAGGGEGELIQ
jgi:flagellar motor switch protein FliG